MTYPWIRPLRELCGLEFPCPPSPGRSNRLTMGPGVPRREKNWKKQKNTFNFFEICKNYDGIPCLKNDYYEWLKNDYFIYQNIVSLWS